MYYSIHYFIIMFHIFAGRVPFIFNIIMKNIFYFLLPILLLTVGCDETSDNDIVIKDGKTRPISDGFRKNNVNYWAFREIRSIIPHL